MAFGPLAGVTALTADEFIRPSTADQRVVARAAVYPVGVGVADQRVAESGAFDVLEAEEAIVAVATGFMGRQ